MPRKIPEQVWTQWVPACGIVGLMLYYALFLYRHALNIPLHDDIFDVLRFLTSVVNSVDLSHTFGIFYENYNEHRTLASRLIYYTAFILEGEINFRTLTFLANLAAPLLLMTLYIPLRQHPRALLLLLPAALILFQPRIYELNFFSMAAFAYMFVYLYGFASILCLREVNAARFMAAIMFASLATFTLASGQLIWLFGLASLLHQRFILRRCALAYPICWFVCAVLILVAWRIGYETPHTMGLVLQDALESPLHHMAFFLTVVGNALGDGSILLAASAGGVMLVVVGYLGVRNIAREDISLDLFAGYVILSILAIAIGRAGYFTLEYALESRLSFPSVLLLATVVVTCLSRMPENRGTLKISVGVILLALFYCVFSFRVYPPVLQGELEDRVKRYNLGMYWVIPYPLKETNAVVKEAVSLGIYHPPARPHPAPNAATYTAQKKSRPLLRKREQRE